MAPPPLPGKNARRARGRPCGGAIWRLRWSAQQLDVLAIEMLCGIVEGPDGKTRSPVLPLSAADNGREAPLRWDRFPMRTGFGVSPADKDRPVKRVLHSGSFTMRTTSRSRARRVVAADPPQRQNRRRRKVGRERPSSVLPGKGGGAQSAAALVGPAARKHGRQGRPDRRRHLDCRIICDLRARRQIHMTRRRRAIELRAPAVERRRRRGDKSGHTASRPDPTSNTVSARTVPRSASCEHHSRVAASRRAA